MLLSKLNASVEEKYRAQTVFKRQLAAEPGPGSAGVAGSIPPCPARRDAAALGASAHRCRTEPGRSGVPRTRARLPLGYTGSLQTEKGVGGEPKCLEGFFDWASVMRIEFCISRWTVPMRWEMPAGVGGAGWSTAGSRSDWQSLAAPEAATRITTEGGSPISRAQETAYFCLLQQHPCVAVRTPALGADAALGITPAVSQPQPRPQRSPPRSLPATRSHRPTVPPCIKILMRQSCSLGGNEERGRGAVNGKWMCG